MEPNRRPWLRDHCCPALCLLSGRPAEGAKCALRAGLFGAWLALHQLAGHEREAYAVMFGIAGTARLVSALAIARQGAGLESIPRRRARLRSIPPKLRGTQRGSLLGYLVA